MIQRLLNNTRLQILTIAGVIILLYIRTLSYEFIGLDEQSLLQDKLSFNKELSNIPKAFKQDVFQVEGRTSSEGATKYYRPVLTISFILDQQFSKDGYSVFRITNMLIHLLAAIGLLFVLQQLKIPRSIAFAFSLLFAAHPLLAQAVAWIPGRNDSLACAFVLWSFYFLARQSRPNTFLHLLFFTLALFTKENTIVLVAICLLYILVIQKNSFSVKDRSKFFSSYAGILLIWYLARSKAIGEPMSVGGNTIGSLYQSFLNSAPLLFQYFQKTILPFNLSVMSVVSDTNYGWVLLAFGVFGAAIYLTKNIPWMEIGFGLLWFLLFFLPTLLFSYFEGMEHRSYLPMVGLLIAFAYTEPVMNLAKNTNKLTLTFGTLVLVFGAITFTRIPAFANELSYWENAFNSSKHSAVVCRDYGIILTKTGEFKKAEQAFLEGIKRDPKEILIHYNLGVLYFKVNELEQAEQQLRQELLLDSTSNPMTYHLLGVIYQRTGRMQEARTKWEKALKVNPGFEPAAEQLRKSKENAK